MSLETQEIIKYNQLFLIYWWQKIENFVLMVVTPGLSFGGLMAGMGHEGGLQGIGWGGVLT